MSHVAESVSIVGVGKVAGQVEVNALLHGVEMLLVRLSQQNSAHFDSQKTLEALCLLPLLKKGRQIICNITVGGNCPPHTHTTSLGLSSSLVNVSQIQSFPVMNPNRQSRFEILRIC